MIPVISSMFSSIGFNPDTSEFLAQYNTGTLGAYGPTTKDEFDQVLAAPSVGVAFNRIIKPTKKYRKVEGEVIVKTVEAEPLPSYPQFLTSYTPEGQEAEVIAETTDLATKASTLHVVDPASHVDAQHTILSIAAMRKTVTDFFKPMKDAAHKAHKAVCDKENETLKPLEAGSAILVKSIVSYEKACEEKRKAEEDRLRIEQQAQADLEAKQESERLALDDAIALEEVGDIAGAEAVFANPAPIVRNYVPPPVVPSSVQRVAGIVGKTTWKARITNPNLVPREWMVIDLAALDKHAQNRKEMAVVPGVEFYPDNSVHGRTK